MSNDEKSTKTERSGRDVAALPYLIIRHSFELRHLGFVIFSESPFALFKAVLRRKIPE
jgi:hypothetical protein